MAEREGFEPSVPIKAHLFSRQASSTTPAPLQSGTPLYFIKSNPYHKGMVKKIAKKDNDLAVASLVLGILSVTGGSILTGIPAIITGVMSQKNPHNKGMGLAGIIMGVIAIVVSILVALFFLAIFILAASAADTSGGDYYEESAPFDSSFDSSSI
jgi:Na+/proline symporter